jgi:hypothetical protein
VLTVLRKGRTCLADKLRGPTHTCYGWCGVASWLLPRSNHQPWDRPMANRGFSASSEQMGRLRVEVTLPSPWPRKLGIHRLQVERGQSISANRRFHAPPANHARWRGLSCPRAPLPTINVSICSESMDVGDIKRQFPLSCSWYPPESVTKLTRPRSDSGNARPPCVFATVQDLVPLVGQQQARAAHTLTQGDRIGTLSGVRMVPFGTHKVAASPQMVHLHLLLGGRLGLLCESSSRPTYSRQTAAENTSGLSNEGLQ